MPPEDSTNPQGSGYRSWNSSSSQNQQHRPSVPSGLRQSQIPPPSPESPFREPETEQAYSFNTGAEDLMNFEDTGSHRAPREDAPIAPEARDTNVQGEINEPSPTATSRLLDFSDQHFHYPADPACQEEDCKHGAFSPRPRPERGGGPSGGGRGTGKYGSFFGSLSSQYRYNGLLSPTSEMSQDEFGGHAPEAQIKDSKGQRLRSVFGDAITDGLLGRAGKKKSSRWVAGGHGVERRGWMYLAHYIPFLQWVPQYRLAYLRGDFVAAVTMASFYVPMALSYASNLAHSPPINGLYAFVWNPLIYSFLGTCPQMVVGPEAAGSLLTGAVVTEAIKRGHIHDADGMKHAQVAGMVTGLSGAIILVAGLCRLGFLDGVLSRPFLRGFISAIGIVILVGQLVPEMGLDKVAEHSQRAQHGSSLDKILFIADHGRDAHQLTCAVSFGTVAIVLLLREIKRRLQPRMSWVAYVPDRFIIVVLSAIITWKMGWQNSGLDILGDIRSQGRPYQVHFPFDEHNFRNVDDAFSTALLIAMLGFFESCVAAKSLSVRPAETSSTTNEDGEEVEEPSGIKGMTVSPNRELIALGVANLIGGLFMAIPAFGGYGRSKVNVSTGGKTPMSSIFLSIITVLCISFLLPYFYYIPKGVLSAMITVVAISLIEEAPHDIYFFYKISGWSELILMFVIFLVTFFWDLKVGIVAGIALSLLRMLRHATRPRIQILGRVPGTNEFDNAEILATEAESGVEMVPHCLIIKIPEPLTFANTGHLKDRLRRLEDHVTGDTHPSLPRARRPTHNQNIIFDIHGVTELDPAAAQVLSEIVAEYVDRGTGIYFCRVPSRKSEVWRLMQASGIVELCGGERNFHRSVEAALRATERDSTLVADIEEYSVPSHELEQNSTRKRARKESDAAPDSSPLTTRM